MPKRGQKYVLGKRPVGQSTSSRTAKARKRAANFSKKKVIKFSAREVEDCGKAGPPPPYLTAEQRTIWIQLAKQHQHSITKNKIAKLENLVLIEWEYRQVQRELGGKFSYEKNGITYPMPMYKELRRLRDIRTAAIGEFTSTKPKTKTASRSSSAGPKVTSRFLAKARPRARSAA